MASWLRAFVGLAAVKAALGLVGLIILLPAPGGREWAIGALRVAGVVLYSGSALLLVFGGRRDTRAVHLGGAFVLLASSLASAPFPALAEMAPRGVSRALEILNHLNPDAFLPLLLWLFFRDFPRRPVLGVGRALPRAGIAVSAAAGVLLFLVAVSPDFAPSAESALALQLRLAPLFWAVVALLGLPAFGYGLWRARAAPAAEKRRMRVFLFGLTLGAGPPLVVLLLAVLLPGVSRELRDPAGSWYLPVALRALALFVPILTTYAVTVQHVLDVRLVVRKAIRYALARYTVIALSAVPLALAAIWMWRGRQLPLGELLTESGVIPLLGLSVAGLLLLRARGGVLERIDRHFFREQYDTRRTLIRLVDHCRSIDSLPELARELRERVDEALHLERVEALFLDRRTACFRSPGGGAGGLPVSSLLVQILGGSSAPLEIDLGNPHSPLSRLPDGERQYLADGASRLLSPMIGHSGELVGFLALGEKRSELGFTGEDRSLLAGVAASAAMTLERLLDRRAVRRPEGASDELADSAVDEDLAGECGRCRAVHPWSSSRCAACGGELEPLSMPYVLQRKYRFRRRLGAGGMGVVYLARDLLLDRWVAIKTLPKVSPERSVWLRREARTMAAISHRNLAQIYGCETWRGVPLLILEYLDGGTLADRLHRAKLAADEVVELGVALGSVLERAHGRGILHRDIKPSNVGYTEHGTPKLLDFGLAKILEGMGGEEATTIGFSDPTSLAKEPDGATVSGFAGTPAYASPEALQGRPAAPSFDLWSLALVLLEAVSGTNPLRAPTRSETLARVLRARVTPVRSLAPGCPGRLAEVLDRALDPNPRRRPQTARAFRVALERASGQRAAQGLA